MIKEVLFCLIQFFLLGSLLGKESLFLRAKGPYQNVEGNETQKKFDVGNEKIEKGDFICIANPTYDLTFKSLFTPMENTYSFPQNLISNGYPERRLMSLLNSIIYPNFEKNPNAEHIIAVELKSTELLANEDRIGNEVQSEDMREKLRALRCDIVCKCTIESGSRQEKSTFFIYFDIEMQRVDVPGRISAFLRYRGILKQHFEGANNNNVKLIAFLNYKTEGEVVADAVVAAIKIDPKTKVITLIDSKGISEAGLSKMIGLKAVVDEMEKNGDIEIVSGKPLKEKGKEWLKLLGVQWWAEKETKNGHRYVVPKNVNCAEVKEALMMLSHKGITDEALQNEYEKILGAAATAQAFEERGREEGHEEGKREGREEGLKEGQLKGQVEGRKEGREEGEKRKMIEMLMKNFIKGRAMDDDDVEEIGKKSLDGAFVRGIWESLNNAANKTEENYEAFLRELRVRNLMAE